MNLKPDYKLTNNRCKVGLLLSAQWFSKWPWLYCLPFHFLPLILGIGCSSKTRDAKSSWAHRIFPLQTFENKLRYVKFEGSQSWVIWREYPRERVREQPVMTISLHLLWFLSSSKSMNPALPLILRANILTYSVSVGLASQFLLLAIKKILTKAPIRKVLKGCKHYW